jgi:hypothetical protein
LLVGGCVLAVASDAVNLEDDLRQFTGTEAWFEHWLRRLKYTEGVQYFAEKAGAYWFLDIVATEVVPLQKQHPFLRVVLSVADNRAEIAADDGDYNEVWSRKLDFTDCPGGKWEFYVTNNVILLPSEY